MFVVEAADGSFWWRFQYSTALFDSARIWRMIGHYQTLLSSILQNPDRRIGDLALLTPGELDQFLAWNDTGARLSRKMCTCADCRSSSAFARSRGRRFRRKAINVR